MSKAKKAFRKTDVITKEMAAAATANLADIFEKEEPEADITGQCGDCNRPVQPHTIHTKQGLYIGTRCKCGSFSQLTSFFLTHEEANKAMEKYSRTGQLEKRIR